MTLIKYTPVLKTRVYSMLFEVGKSDYNRLFPAKYAVKDFSKNNLNFSFRLDTLTPRFCLIHEVLGLCGLASSRSCTDCSRNLLSHLCGLPVILASFQIK